MILFGETFVAFIKNVCVEWQRRRFECRGVTRKNSKIKNHFVIGGMFPYEILCRRNQNQQK